MIRIPVTKTAIEKVRVPAELLEPCRQPDMDSLETTGDLERIAGEAVASLTACNADKAAIKSWNKEE